MENLVRDRLIRYSNDFDAYIHAYIHEYSNEIPLSLVNLFSYDEYKVMKVRGNVLRAIKPRLLNCFYMTGDIYFKELCDMYIKDVIDATKLKVVYIDLSGKSHTHRTEKEHIHRSDEIVQLANERLKELLR